MKINKLFLILLSVVLYNFAYGTITKKNKGAKEAINKVHKSHEKITEIIDDLKNFGAKIEDKLKPEFSKIVKKVENVKPKLEDAVKVLKEKGETLLQKSKETLSKVGKKIKEVGGKVLEKGKEATSTVSKKAKELAKSFIDWWNGGVKKVREGFIEPKK